MARSISVKVPTATLIADIEAAIAKIDEDAANYPALYAQYEADVEEYNKAVHKAMIDYIVVNPKLVKVDTMWNDRTAVIVPTALLNLPEKPVAPEKPDAQQSFGREWTTRKALLQRNLKVLKMTTQEEVSASTYGAIIELL